MTVIEFRTRTAALPDDFGGELRIWLGDADTRAEEDRLRHQRAVLKKIARRRQWDVLRGIKDGRYTTEQVVRVVDESGIDTLHLELRSPAAPPPIDEAVDQWLQTIAEDRTRDAYEIRVGRLLDHVGRDTPVDRIGEHDIEDALDRLRGDGLARNTLAGTITAWSALFTWLMDRDRSVARKEGRPPMLDVHPVRESRRLREVKTHSTRVRFLSREEYDRLIEAAPRQMRAQYATLTFAGLRIGEFVHLRPQDVDLPARIRIQDHGPAEWSPKGYPRWDHGIRDVPIHRTELLPHLEWYAREMAGERRFFVNFRNFEPWTARNFRRQMERDCEAAGLIYGRDAEDGVTPHTLRHTLASWLAQRDVQLQKIAELLGDTVSTVSTYYAHLLPSDLDETLNEAL